MLHFMQFNFTKRWPKKVWSGTCLSPCPAGCRGSPASLQPESPECLPAQCHHVVSLHEEGNLTTSPPRRWHVGGHIPCSQPGVRDKLEASHLQQVQMARWVYPQFLPCSWHCSCLFHIPPALQMTYSPFRAISGANWGWIGVHEPPQNSICPARAEASASASASSSARRTKQMCCTTLSDVTVAYKTYEMQKDRQWELLRSGSTTVVLFISITKNITFKCLN